MIIFRNSSFELESTLVSTCFLNNKSYMSCEQAGEWQSALSAPYDCRSGRSLYKFVHYVFYLSLYGLDVLVFYFQHGG